MYDLKLLNIIKDVLIERALTIAVAESSSGGLLSAHLTHLSGASIYYQGDVVTYANDAKTKILLVNPELIELYGAVSSEVALEMAKGVKRMFATDIGLSVTGITGPSGGSDEKPIGLTYISLCAPQFERTERYVLKREREQIRQKSVQKALELLHTYLMYEKA